MVLDRPVRYTTLPHDRAATEARPNRSGCQRPYMTSSRGVRALTPPTKNNQLQPTLLKTNASDELFPGGLEK